MSNGDAVNERADRTPEADDPQPVVTAPAAVAQPPELTIVTGATGWLGAALVHALTRGRWARPGVVRVLVTNRVDGERLAAASTSLDDGSLVTRIEPVIADLTDRRQLERLFDAPHASVDVLHAAGVIHPRRVAEFTEVNAEGTRRMVELAARHGVRRFVHVSSNSPFGTNAHSSDRFRNDEPYHPYLGYGHSKMLAELAVLDAVEHGLDAVIVRPPWFYGPHQPLRQTTFFKLVRSGRFPVIGRGDQVRSMVYVDNLVQGIVRAELVATPPGRSWWIADARPYTVSEIVETVGRALAAEGFTVAPNRLRLPPLASGVAELLDRAIQRTGRYHQQLHVLGEMGKHIACDVSVARSELGYEPEIELFEGMRRSIRWCRQQGIEL